MISGRILAREAPEAPAAPFGSGNGEAAREAMEDEDRLAGTTAGRARSGRGRDERLAALAEVGCRVRGAALVRGDLAGAQRGAGWPDEGRADGDRRDPVPAPGPDPHRGQRCD